MATQTTQRSSEEPASPQTLSKWGRIFSPSLADVVFIAIFFMAYQLGGILTHRDGDIGRHIRLGRSVLDDGQIPIVDIYSHTSAGGEMIPHEWLSQTVFAATERWFGFDGIGVLVALLAAIPWFFVYRHLVRRGIGLGVSLVVVFLGAAASAIHWASRPHAFTWLFIVAWILLLEDFRIRKRNHVWWLVPLVVLWANTHGAFVIGFIILGTYALGSLIESRQSGGDLRGTRHLFIVLAATVAASLLNPAGLETILNSFAYAGEDFLLQFTWEYNSPDFHNTLFWPFLAMILLSVVLAFRWSATTFLLTMSWTALALYSFRNIPLYALIMAPVIATGLDAWWRQVRAGKPSATSRRVQEYTRIERQAMGGVLALAFVALISLSLARAPESPFAFTSSYHPIAALEAMGDTPHGERVFNEFHWGGYLEYCCHPEIPVFIDGQTDYYGAALTMEYDSTLKGEPGWRGVLEKYRVDWVLIPPEAGLAQVLIEADDWAEVFRDDVAVVFVPTR